MGNHEQVLHELQNVRRALDQSAIVAITDAKGVITHVNDKFVQISKYPREELLGNTHKVLNSGFHNEGFFQELWQTISSGQIWEGDIHNRAKDGSKYWVHTVIVPFRDQAGKIQEYVSIRYDITGKKESENNLRNLIDAAFEGIFIYDLSGRVVWSNGLVAKMLGRSEQAFAGTYVSDILPELEIFSTGSIQYNFGHDAHVKVLEVTSKSYYYSGHNSYLVAIKDITEKIHLEAQILQQDRLASIGLLSSGLAHEIGTPLGIMRGRAELLLQKLGDEASLKSGLGTIIQQIDRISGLIQNLLGLARGNVAAKPEGVLLASLVSDVSTLLIHEFRRYNVELQTDIPEGAKVFAVYPSLYQVFLNLMVNAVHAMKEEHTKNEQHQGRLLVRAEKVNSYWRIAIQDNGCGIDPENFSKLFTPFFTTKEIGVGTGLGLATSFKIISSWGGRIEVESQLGKGATFIVSLKDVSR